MTAHHTQKTCPAVPCEQGAVLLGVIAKDGTVTQMRTAMEIDADFVSRASAQGDPTRNMRFAGPCITRGCANWQDGACQVVNTVLDRIDLGLRKAPDAENLPPCLIRGTCRWFSQRGARACHACTEVTTKEPCRSEDIPEYQRR